MRLRTFGGLWIEGDPGTPPLRPRQMGLLAVVAASGRKGISRQRTLGILWAETEEQDARHTLSQNLYSLKRETGREWVVAAPDLRLHPDIGSDIGEFLEALAAGDLGRVAQLYAGPFLEGFYLPGVPEFERWVEEERGRIHTAALRAIEQLATRASEAGHHPDALRWWHRLTQLDPLSARFAAGYMRALAAAGDRVGALAHARAHEEVIRRELEADLEPSIRHLVATLRTPDALPATPRLVALPPAGGPLPPPGGGEAPAPPTTPGSRARSIWQRPGIRLATLLIVVGGLALGLRSLWSGAGTPFLAVGAIRLSGGADTSVSAGVLRDMLATGLGRIPGLQVVANSRLVELTPRGADTIPSAATDAARRAGATEVVEGEVRPGPDGLLMTFRRVSLTTGLVRQGYEVRAAGLSALVDSAAAALASDLHLSPPTGPSSSRVSPAAYALYEEGLRAFYKYDVAAAYRLMTAALERDSNFTMAAYYAWRASQGIADSAQSNPALRRAKRLAHRGTERERLLIEGSVAAIEAPLAHTAAIAETLTVRYPADPDGQILLGEVRFAEGDWAGSVAAYERAVTLDSAAGAIGGSFCRVCTAAHGIARSYLWWDSAGAAERAARRFIALRPDERDIWNNLLEPLLRQGRRAEAVSAARSAMAVSLVQGIPHGLFDRDLIRWGRFEEVDRRLSPELRSPFPAVRDEARWLLVLSLRDQGRIREAEALPARGTERALLAMEAGSLGEAATIFRAQANDAWRAPLPGGLRARGAAWMLTLAGTALAGTGDTVQVRRMADSVEVVGALSSFGRDRRLHWVLRGLLQQREGRHAEAVETLRRGMFSATDGYTVTNLLMARSLLTIGRPLEAIAVLRPAIRGGVDGSNTYVSRTDLHEALAQAFDLAGQDDSARVHYLAVEQAWRRADPEFQGRYARATTWLAVH